MYFLAHAIAQSGVDHLVALYAAPPFERPADDQRLEMLAVAGYFQVIASKAGADPTSDTVWRNHDFPHCLNDCLTDRHRIGAGMYARSAFPMMRLRNKGGDRVAHL